MKKLVGSNHFSDLAIKCTSGTIPVHKLIFLVRCPEILKHHGETIEINWSDIPECVVLAFLETIYTGTFTIELDQENKHQLLKLAHRYVVQDFFQDTEVFDSEQTSSKGNQDQSLLNENEIEDIRQFSQSQKCLADSERSNQSSMLDAEILDCLLEENISSNTLQPDGQSDTEKSIEVLWDSKEVSSPDLFPDDSDRDAIIKSSSDEEDIPGSSNAPIVSSSPMKFTELKSCSTQSSSGLHLSNLSPLKSVDHCCEITKPQLTDSNKILSQKQKYNKLSSSEDSEPTDIAPKKTRKESESSAIESKSSPTISTNNMFLGEYNNFHEQEKAEASPFKSDRKRSLEDMNFKTPKREKLDQPSTSRMQIDDLDFADDIWASFEKECCINMQLDSPMPILGSPEELKKSLSQRSNINITPKTGFASTQHHAAKTSKSRLSLTQPNIAKTPKSGFPSTQPSHIKIYDQVTPLPNYQKMITPELREALKKYGVRKLPRSKAVRLLHHIYELTHPLADEDEDVSAPATVSLGKNDQIPKEIAAKSKKSPKPRKKTKQGTTCKSPEEKRGKTAVRQTDDDLSSSNTSNSEMPEETVCGSTAFDGNLRQAIRHYLTGNQELYEKILLYETISVEELIQNLKKDGISITMQQLVTFLDEQCITFSLPRSEKYKKKQQARTQRFRKKVLAKISKESST